MSRLVSFIIRALKEDPLSTGMLDVFFRKYRIMCLFYKESFIYLKFAVVSTASTQIILAVGCSSIPSLEMYCLLDNPPH
jgi:hypothetical protein